jgi:hypothetical protein
MDPWKEILHRMKNEALGIMSHVFLASCFENKFLTPWIRGLKAISENEKGESVGIIILLVKEIDKHNKIMESAKDIDPDVVTPNDLMGFDIRSIYLCLQSLTSLFKTSNIYTWIAVNDANLLDTIYDFVKGYKV